MTASPSQTATTGGDHDITGARRRHHVGGAGADAMSCYADDDALTGDPGDDVIKGGAGADSGVGAGGGHTVSV